MNRIALVIGNSKYKYVKRLNNPINDANDISEILTSLGFKVYKYLDLPLSEISNVVRQFMIDLDDYSTGLFYYAGHGMQIDGKNYIVPTDCQLLDKKYTIFSCYNIDDYLNGLKEYRGKTNICILDACRNNPYAEARDINEGFAPFSAQPSGTIIAYSTSPDNTASDGCDKNGLYTQVLKECMQIPNLKIEEMFKAVRIQVSKLSCNTQVSWEHSSLVGDFYFSVKQQSVNVNIPDEEIYSYIQEQFKHYELITDDSDEIEAMSYVAAYNKFHLPMLKLLRAYCRIDYKKQNFCFSDSTIDELNNGYLKGVGFSQKNGRWYYKEKYVEMGDPLPLCDDLLPLEPLEGKKILIDGKLSTNINGDQLLLKLDSNIPNETPLIFSLQGDNYFAQSCATVVNCIALSEGFTDKDNFISNGFYILGISCPISSVLPPNLIEIYGEKNRNLIGKYIKFRPIGGNTIDMRFRLLVHNKEIIIIDK
nr:caspase family protein [uncultured Anaerosporobacter sp.]